MSSTDRYLRNSLRVYWGPRCLDHLARELARVECSRPLVLCGQTLSQSSGVLDSIRNAAGGRVVGVFGGVSAHSPIGSVLEAAELAMAIRADCLVAVGGGSALVTTRAVAICVAEGTDLAAHATFIDPSGAMVSPRLDRPKLPIFAIPTTPTSASAKAASALTAPGLHGRLAMFDPKTRAQAIFVQDDLLLISPTDVVTAAGLASLVMALEGLLSPVANVFSDAMLSHAVRELIATLPTIARSNDARPLAALVLSSILVGEGTDSAGGGIAAALSHTIGRQVRAPNGLVDAIVIVPVLEISKGRRPQRIAAIARQVGCVDVASELKTVLDQLGTPSRLRDIGVPRRDLRAIADEAMSDFAIHANPDVDRSDVMEVLLRAW